MKKRRCQCSPPPKAKHKDSYALKKEMKASPFLWPDNFTGLSVDALAEHLSLSAFFLCFRIHEATTSFLATASTALLPQKLLCKPITTKNPQHWTGGKSFLAGGERTERTVFLPTEVVPHSKTRCKVNQLPMD